jgi:hypothetical protein
VALREEVTTRKLGTTRYISSKKIYMSSPNVRDAKQACISSDDETLTLYAENIVMNYLQECDLLNN